MKTMLLGQIVTILKEDHRIPEPHEPGYLPSPDHLVDIKESEILHVIVHIKESPGPITLLIMDPEGLLHWRAIAHVRLDPKAISDEAKAVRKFGILPAGRL